MSYVAVSPIGHATAAALLWRHRGQRYVTAVAKATFALTPEARMTPIEPMAIAFGEHDDPYGSGLAAGGDVVPYLHQVDVTIAGHVELPPHFASTEVHVELEIARGQTIVLDRQLVLDGEKRTGPEQRHVHVTSMGPVSRNDAGRHALLRGHDPTRLLPPEMNIPEDLDWEFFQAAPSDQRLKELAGDEWLVLGGFFCHRPRLRTLLPGARGVARLYHKSEGVPREGEPLSMHIDMLQIDVDQSCCSIVWRGYAALNEDPAALHVVAGVQMPGETLTWQDPIERAEQAVFEDGSRQDRPSRPWIPSGSELGETVILESRGTE